MFALEGGAVGVVVLLLRPVSVHSYFAKSRVNRYTVKTVNTPSLFLFFFVYFLGSFLMCVSFQCCIKKLK